MVTNQGLVWTADGGERWSWRCDSDLDATRVYDVLALGGGEAVVATLGGIARVDADCGHEAYTGVPENSYADQLVLDGEDLLVAISGSEAGGIFRCAEGACAPTGLYEAGLFVKSILPVEGGFYATLTRSEDLSAALLWSADGQTWEERYAWPDGDVDPRALYGYGARLYVWSIPRGTEDVARLLRSSDGGLSFTAIAATETYTTAEGTLLQVGSGLLFGHDQGLVLWSEDGGDSWEDRTESLPTVVCGAAQGERAWICADHLYDGIDLAVSEDGWTWTPVACLEEATLPACAAEACEGAAERWAVAASLGGGRCDEPINPPAVEEEGGCGCGGEKGLETAALLLPLALLGRRRGARRPARG